jgi:hypothetical protein
MLSVSNFILQKYNIHYKIIFHMTGLLEMI